MIFYDDTLIMSNPDDYTVGWICALSTELVAARAFLDEEHPPLKYQCPEDSNGYILGRIHNHNIAIAVLPSGLYGTTYATNVVTNMRWTFLNIRIGLLVGIGGGVPSPKHDIRLGDVVVSTPTYGSNNAVLQYDCGIAIQNQGFKITSVMKNPPISLLSAVNALRARYDSSNNDFEEAIEEVLQKKERLRRKYSRPDPGTDRLYKSEIAHPPDSDEACSTVCGDDPLKLILRSPRLIGNSIPMIHYGTIASANQVMKDAHIRDRLSMDHDVLCFDMEAAGVMNFFPCLVIRGICDYSDSHKRKEWQGYAAMTAAAYAKELLGQIPTSNVEVENPIDDKIVSGRVYSEGNFVKVADWRVLDEEDMQEDDEYQKIGNGVIRDDFAPHQSNYFGKFQKGVSGWPLPLGGCATWFAQRNQTLFRSGIPGAGKTNITSAIFQHLAHFRDLVIRVISSTATYAERYLRLQSSSPLLLMRWIDLIRIQK